MVKKYFLIPVIIFFFCCTVRAQSISSTTAGGNWNDTKTWVGGVIPNENYSVVINGPVVLGGGTIINLTVNSSGSLEDECCNGRTVTIKGDFINYGTIKDNYGGVTISVMGNVHNYGKLVNYGLAFSGNHVQYLESSTVISCKHMWKSPDGTIKASGPLTFDSTFSADLRDDTLDMGSYKLIKLRNTVDTHSFDYGVINSNGEIDISGVGVMHSNLAGDFTLVGNYPMECGGFTVYGNLKIGPGKVITDECCNGRTITVKGNLINNGIIKDKFAGLGIAVEGDVINNSVMINSLLQFSGKKPQKIGGTNSFGTKYIEKNPNGVITAASDLVFDSSANVNLDQDTLFMGKNKLTKYSSKIPGLGSNYFTNGIVISDGEIDVERSFSSDLGGNFVLTGSRPMEFGTCKIRGNLVIAKGKEIADEPANGRSIEVWGDLINYGKITNHYAGLGITAFGNIYNYSIIDNSWIAITTKANTIEVMGNFNCSLSLQSYDNKTPGTVKVAGYLSSKKDITTNNPVKLEVPDGCILSVQSGYTFNNNLNIMGQYSLKTPFSDNFAYRTEETLMSLQVVDRGKCDTVLIILTNTTPHPEMTSSVKRWWKIVPNSRINKYILKFKYTDELLNGNDPNTLCAYFSTDEGKLWKKLSTPLNTTRDPVNKTITIGTWDYPLTEELGEIILSSGGIVSTPSLKSTIIGRSQIRVGPPNRYTISYWNSSDVPTDDFFFILNTEGGVHIKSVILTETATGKQIEYPGDSLTYDNQDEAILFASALNVNEARNFDIILTAEPGTTQLKKANAGPVIFVVGYWIAGKLVKKYIKSSLIEGCYEMWRPSGADVSAKDAVSEAIANSIESARSKERPVKIISESAAKEVIKRGIGDILWPVDLAKDILKCLGNSIRGMKDYVTGEFEENRKEFQKVTSWDPNAKEGPAGYGSKGYIAASAPMTYTIFFENKKEATAPAYKIVVWDTLDKNIYDVNTVEFLKMSHPNTGIASRTDNKLKWEFTAIELPPNVNPPEGEGWVQFRVHPKTGLPTGSVLKNRSTIVFDLNPPLSTNLVTNTLDFEAPVTTVNTPKYIEGKKQVYLEWAGDDKSGSGIKTSTVFMASGDGPYTQAATSDSSKALVSVIPGQIYKFYVLSQDNVGNLEKTPKEIKQIQTGVDEEKTVPEKFLLMQNYPNPFNPVTTIKFTLNEPGHSTLKVYNLLGEVVRVLVDKYLNTGYHKVEFNAENLASGVYFYHLLQNNHSEVRKMMLIK